MVAGNGQKTAEIDGIVVALAVGEEHLQQRHVAVGIVHALPETVEFDAEGAAGVHHGVAVALGLGKILGFQIGLGILLAATALPFIVKIPLPGHVFHRHGPVLVAVDRLSLHQQLVPGFQAVQTLVVILDLPPGLVDALQEQFPETVEILGGEHLTDLLQPEAFVDQVADDLDAPHGGNAVIAVMAGRGDLVRPDQADLFIIAQHALGHVANLTDLADGIEVFFHILRTRLFILILLSYHKLPPRHKRRGRKKRSAGQTPALREKRNSILAHHSGDAAEDDGVASVDGVVILVFRQQPDFSIAAVRAEKQSAHSTFQK